MTLYFLVVCWVGSDERDGSGVSMSVTRRVDVVVTAVGVSRVW